MTRTFLIEVDMIEGETADDLAIALQTQLEQGDFDVLSVKPWASPLSPVSGGSQPLV